MEQLYQSPTSSTVKATKNSISWNWCGNYVQWIAHKISECKKETKCEPFGSTKHANIASSGNFFDLNESDRSLAEESVQSKDENIEMVIPIRKHKSKPTKGTIFSRVDVNTLREGQIDSE